MDVQTFRKKFSTDSSLMSLPDERIQDALEEADLVVSLNGIPQLPRCSIPRS